MPAAHFEHTVAMTDTGVDILTDGRPPAAEFAADGDVHRTGDLRPEQRMLCYNFRFARSRRP